MSNHPGDNNGPTSPRTGTTGRRQVSNNTGAQHATSLLLRVRDAASMLAISERQVWVLLRQGSLRAIRPPGMRAIRIARAEVEALVVRWSDSGGVAP